MADYKVSIVNYLNSAPYVYGLKRSDILNIQLHLDHPSESARKLVEGEVDIALAPVAIIPKLKNHSIISDYCIGCDGPVRTVKLFSEVPVNQIERIYLDYQSETSVGLTRILCRDHWKISPKLVIAYPGFQKDIYGYSAGLIIGDRAIRVLGQYPFEIDLGEAWKDHTGMPFVFAVWLSNKTVGIEWKHQFNRALANGLEHRAKIADNYNHLNTDHFSVKEYLNSNIEFEMDDTKHLALDTYLKMIKSL